MKLSIEKEWLAERAAAEGDLEIGAECPAYRHIQVTVQCTDRAMMLAAALHQIITHQEFGAVSDDEAMAAIEFVKAFVTNGGRA